MSTLCADFCSGAKRGKRSNSFLDSVVLLVSICLISHGEPVGLTEYVGAMFLEGEKRGRERTRTRCGWMAVMWRKCRGRQGDLRGMRRLKGRSEGGPSYQMFDIRSRNTGNRSGCAHSAHAVAPYLAPSSYSTAIKAALATAPSPSLSTTTLIILLLLVSKALLAPPHPPRPLPASARSLHGHASTHPTLGESPVLPFPSLDPPFYLLLLPLSPPPHSREQHLSAE